MKRNAKNTYRTTEYDDPEIYFERVRQRKKRQEEEAFKKQKIRSYREEKEYFEKSKTLRQYGSKYDDEEIIYDRDNTTRSKKNKAYIQRENNRTQITRKQKKKKSKFVKVLIGIAVVLLLLIIAAAVIWFNPELKKKTLKSVIASPFGTAVVRMIIGTNYENNVRDKNFNDNNVIINQGANTPSGNITFALIGVDARSEDLTIGTLADSMIVVNVDSEGEIKMGSIYRDTYLLSRTSDGSEVISKANSAYFRNGPLGTINLMNENFDLAITDYIVVNFAGLSNIIDTLGGITLKVTQEEMDALNYHMYEQNEYAGTEYIPLETYGDAVHLTGNQATAFCRLRKITFISPLDGETYTDDYGRTARQRYVLTELVKQTKDKGVLKLLGLMNDLFKANSGEKKFIQTSLTIGELTKIIAKGFDMNLSANAAFPDYDHQYTTILDSGDSMVADTLEENAVLLHQFLYPSASYEPTADLINIANKIRNEVARQVN